MTLTEACIALTFVGILIALAAPGARHGLDIVKVRAAREAAFGAAIRARAVALAQGGADLIIDIPEGSATVINSAGVVAAATAFSSYDVEVIADGAAARFVLRYDAHGIGRMASRTLRFRRGSAEAGITISSYGRVRRW